MPADKIVILTREHDDNLALIERLAAFGLEIIEYPCIATRLLPYAGGEVCGKPVTNFDLIAFTSKRAVTGFASAAEKIKDSRQTLAAVGTTTARALEQELGRGADLIGEPQTGEGLAQVIISKIPTPGSALYVQGNKTTNEFKRALAAAGWSVCDLVVYENYSPDPKPLELPGQAVAVFASPSAAMVFFRANPGLKGTVTSVAIGPTTEKCLHELGVGGVAVAQKPEPDYLVESVLKAVKGGARP